MHGSSSNEGARTEADKVAALVDSIADKVVAGRPINGVEPKADPLHGPDITAQVLEERLLALASALRTPDQVKVRFFEQILGFSISSPETGKVVGTQGAVGQGTYLLEVEPPYDGGPLGNLDVQLRSDSPTPCEFSYRSVAHKLESMSYQAFPRPKYQDPGVEFVREAGRFAAIVTLSVDSRESPRCIRNINFVLQDVKDGRLED